MTQRLLETKFHIPARRPGTVARPHLVAALQAGLDERRKLTLISAPAGYGKTTLAAEWVHTLTANQRVVWLALDDADNQPVRFFDHWLAALSRVHAGLAQGLQTLADATHFPPLPTMLDDLINALADLTLPLLIVFDDYHAITAPQLHEAVAYFVEHQPAHVHLVLTTRVDPPLPLARLRARGQMTEMRAHHLRFTPDEVRTFFAQAMRLDLDAETIRTVEARTEGWAAGLQLAALALQNLPNPQAFVASFGGSHRYVLDYLAEEVIRQLGEETRRFLMQTSVLARFNAAMCAALTGRTDSQAILQNLEQANLFLVLLDDERIWYRYHHLFADYLRTLLTRAEAVALCKQASAWCETNDLTAEAVQYALNCADADFTADAVARALRNNTTWSGGNVAMLSAWLDALAPHAYVSRPQLSLDASRILYLAGRFELAEVRIEQAEQNLHSQPATPESEEMLALAALYRGAIAAVRGHVQQAIEQTVYAQARLPRANHLAQARGFFSLGLAYELADQTPLAVQNYLLSSAEAEAAGVLFLAIHARCAAAQVQIAQGRLQLAEATCQAAIQLADGARLAPLGLAWVTLGGIVLEHNDLASAARFLQDGMKLARQGGLSDDVILALAHLARLRAVQGDTAGALAAIQELTAIIQAYGVSRMSMLAAAHLARLHLYTGQRQAAAQWAAGYQARRTASAHEYEELTLARVLLATGGLDTMPAVLRSLLEKAESAGRGQTVIEASLLLGLCQHARKDDVSALALLEKSLRLAAPEGYMRIFLDEGAPLLALLPNARAVAPDYVDALLAALQPADVPRASPLADLPAPLSEQERRVLDLIVAGKSNRAIAEELVITVGTAKWHVHNVLQKLGVSNRPQAIAQARELGIG